MGSACKLSMTRAELIAIMQHNISWEDMKPSEAQELHRKIVQAANLICLAAPEALKPSASVRLRDR